MSLPDLKPPPQSASEFYLEKIHARLANLDPSYDPLLDTAAKLPTLSPPRYAIWVNSLWFLSFAISLTYATLAMMLQQWGRRYIRVTQQLRSSPQNRARLRAFFSDAIDGLHVLWVIEGVRAMIHLSMFLFFAGLLIYLFNICHAVFIAVVWWMALSAVVYVSFTLLPIFRPNSPYYAPLSPTLWFLFACTSFAVFQVLSSEVFRFLGPNAVAHFRGLRDYYRQRFSEDIRKIAEENASQQSPVIDVRVLESTFHDLSEDSAWERFFEAVPGFLSSKQVNGVKDHLSEEFRKKFEQALDGFLDRTFSFNSVTELVRGRRLVICLNAAHAVLGVSGISQVFTYIFSGRWPELLQSPEVGHSLRRWSNSSDKHDKHVTWDVRRIVAQIIVRVRERDDRWISLAKTEYGIAGHVLRDYIGHGDSVLLSILTHMTREAFRARSWSPWILSSLADFRIRDTFPELQHAFCALWNDIVLEAWNEEGPENIPVRILREIRHACIALHQDTDAVLTTFSASTHHFDPVLGQPRSYRVCKIASHRQCLTMRTPFTGSPAVPSLFFGQSAASSHHYPSPIGTDHTPDGRPAPQLAEEANVIVESQSPSTTDHTKELISPPATNSTLIAQPASIFEPSAENTGTGVTRDPGLLVPDEASHDPHQQPAPSAAEIAGVATTARPDDPTPQLQISEMGDISQAPAEVSLTSVHLDSALTPIPLSSSFVPDLRDDPDTLQPITVVAMLSYPPKSHPEQQDAILSRASLASIVNPTLSIATASPTIIVSDSLSSRVVHPVHSGGISTERPLSSLESAPIQPDHMSDTSRPPPSSPITSSSRIPLQATSVSFAQVSADIGVLGPHDDTGDSNPPIPMTALLHSTQTAIPAHDVASSTLPLENRVQRDPDKP